jgi:hypothetical protein
MGLFVAILALVLVGAMWYAGEQDLRQKVIVTVVYVALWGLIFIDGWLLLAGQGLFCIVVGYWTFGSSFGRGR